MKKKNLLLKKGRKAEDVRNGKFKFKISAFDLSRRRT